MSVPRNQPDPFQKYQSLADSNPFTTNASFRETLKEREAYFPPASNGLARWHYDTDIAPVSTLTSERTRDIGARSSPTHMKHMPKLSDPKDGISNPRIRPSNTAQPPSRQSLYEGSTNDAFYSDSSHSGTDNNHSLLANKPEVKQYRPVPKFDRTISIPLPDGSKSVEHNQFTNSYKVVVRDPETSNVTVRSPLKKLFGEKGLLSRSAHDLTKSTSTMNLLARKVKKHVDGFMENIPSVELLNNRRNIPPVSTFLITIDEYTQGHLYFRLELMLNQEISKFLSREFEKGRVSHESIKKTYDNWTNQGRAQVRAFQFDLATQRELVGMNIETLHFCGVNGFDRVKLVAAMNAWKVLARELSIRTFCNADSAIKKHLFDAERILELVNADPEAMLAFQDIRSKTMGEIYCREQLDRERHWMHGIERVWSPTKMI